MEDFMKNTMRRLLCAVMAAVMVLSLVACGGSDTTTDESAAKDDGKGSVYYLNFKPESEEQWKKIAEDYEKETGVPVKVVTAASGTYEQTLKSEIAKKDAPTLFQINGPVGYEAWKEYCADSSSTQKMNK